MRRMLFPLMVAAVACQAATTELTDERRAEIAAEVTTLDSEYWDAWRAADWDRGMSYYVDSPDFVWAAGGTVYLGLDALEQTRPRFATVARQTFTFRNSKTDVIAPDVASVTALGTWAQTDTAGVTSPARPFAWTAIWVLHDGEWKMRLVHMSYPAPLPGAM